MNRKGKILTALTVALITVGIIGCASADGGKDLEERRAIIDDYAAIILQQDQDSAQFDEALAAVNAYLDDMTPEQKEETEALLENVIQQLQDDSDGYLSYEPSEELQQMLENQGISLEEYQINADSRYIYMQGFIQDLAYLQEYLEYAGEGYAEDLERVCYMMTEEQKYIRAYSYTGVNYWFAGWGEQEVEYIRQQVLDKFTSFSAEDAQWLDSREAVEARMNTYLDSVEELADQWTAYIGESAK